MNMIRVTILLFFSLFFTTVSAQEKDTILFFGDSITAGYGIDLNQAFPALIQEKIDSLGLPYDVVNAGLSGETSAGGLRRVDWVMQQEVDIFVLELGGNDGLRGIDPQNTEKNLAGIIEKVRAADPDVKILLTGMEAPPNLGQAYTSQFRQLFRDVARQKNVHFLPFILDGVAGDPELNLPDGIHPTAEGHKILAENVWDSLRPMLDEE